MTNLIKTSGFFIDDLITEIVKGYIGTSLPSEVLLSIEHYRSPAIKLVNSKIKRRYISSKNMPYSNDPPFKWRSILIDFYIDNGPNKSHQFNYSSYVSTNDFNRRLLGGGHGYNISLHRDLIK